MDLQRDILFRDQEELWARLEFLAAHMAEAVLSGVPTPASVFGISAPWGAGKSSALRILLDLLFEDLQQRVPNLTRDSRGFSKNGEYLVTHSTFRANLHSSSQQPARLGLAYEVLQGFPAPYAEELLEDLDYRPTRPGSGAPIRAEIFLREKLGDYARTGPAIEEWILRSFLNYRDRDGQREFAHIHVELVDDLDRCPESYSADVLAALNYWSALENLFFVLAADEGHLQRSAIAATDRQEQYTGEALEKFVHTQLRLPALVGDRRRAAAFMAALIPQGVSLEPGLEHLHKLLTESATAGPFGLLSPTLTARSPRQAKRRLNDLVQEFRVLRDFQGDSVKRIVARMMWPDEYTSYIVPPLFEQQNSKDGVSAAPRAAWLRSILEAVRVALEGSEDELAGSLARLREQLKLRGIDLQGCSEELVLYLGAPPALVPPEVAARHLPFSGEVRDGSFDASRAISTIDRGLGAERPPRIEDLAIQIETALELRRVEDAAHLAAEFVRLAEIETSPAVAPTIGNIALRLPMVDVTLAWAAHQAAMRLHPGHANIRLNAADFLLDHGGPDSWILARDLIVEAGRLDPNLKPGRQRLLRARAAVALGLEVEELEALVDDASGDEVAFSYQIERLQVAGRVRDFAKVEKIGRVWAEQTFASGDNLGVGLILRHMSDSLVLAPVGSDFEKRATDVLKHILRTGYLNDQEVFLGAAYNLALVIRRKHSAAAAALFRVHYQMQPQDALLKGEYSRLLLNDLSDPHNAYSVQQGQEVTIPMPSADDLKQCFADVPGSETSDRWWETYLPEAPLQIPPYCPLEALCPPKE